MIRLTTLVVFLNLITVAIAEDSSWESSGEISFESRIFKDDDQASTEDRGLALFTRLETKYDGDKLDVVVRAFARVDRYDNGRDVYAFEDAHLKYELGPAYLLGGYQLFNWSIMEVFQPVDMINSTNFDSNIENQDKIGELTFSARFDIFEGDITFYYFPKYEKPIPPGRRSRLGIDLGFAVEDPAFVEKNNFVSTDNYGSQYGVRFTQSLDDAEFSLHYLHFMDRLQPLYFFNGTTIKPHLFMIDQFGGTLSYILTEGLIGKLESTHKDFISNNSISNVLLGQARRPVDHWQNVLGFEYGWGNDNGSDTTVFTEYQLFIADDDVTDERRDELGIFQNDLFIGMRHSFNDVAGKELILSFIKDMDRSHELLFQATYSQRLDSYWKIKAGLRYIDAPIKNKPTPVGLEVLHQDHQFSLALSRFF